MAWWSAFAGLATATNFKGAGQALGTAALTLVGMVCKDWWSGRDRYQAHLTWDTINGPTGREDVPVIYIQNTSDKPLNFTMVRVHDPLRRRVDEYPFHNDDPDYDPLPRAVNPHEQTRFYLYEPSLRRTAERAGWLAKLLRIPRVYIGLTSMGGRRRLFAAERALPYDYRLARYR